MVRCLLIKKIKRKAYSKCSKYPAVWLDISVLVPLSVTVDEMQRLIVSSENRIEKVELKDFFQRKDWTDKKSLTFRFVIRDKSKTLQKDEIDKIWEKVASSVKDVGAEIR